MRWRRRHPSPVNTISNQNNVGAHTAERLLAMLNVGKVNNLGQPNLEEINRIVANIEITNLNLKYFGYKLARDLCAALPAADRTSPRHVQLECKASTQADMESEWVQHWCSELKTPVIMHRKQWELAYVLQAIFEQALLEPGCRGIGFGCGEEPIASYLASRNVQVTITDLPPERSEAAGWSKSGQYASSLERACQRHLVDRDVFATMVDHAFVDMNAIPPDLRDYDFCWSICALEHLGSIERGMAFVKNSLDTLKPGGLAVHTTEFNISDEGDTIDNWPTVLFQRKHLEELARILREEGHEVAPFNFDLGGGPMDHFIDLPPWDYNLPKSLANWLGQPSHLKLSIDGFASTCFGLVIRRSSAT